MHRPATHDDALLARQLDDICEGLREAIEREVESLRREGLPVYISENGNVVDLNPPTSNPD